MEEMRRKVRELHAKTRRQLLGNILAPFVAAACCGFGIKQFHDPMLRSAFAFAIAWSLAGLYFLNRGMWSASLSGAAGVSTGIEAYRREVERRRSLVGRFMAWVFGPVVFAVATLILLVLGLGTGRGMPLQGTLLKMAPFLALVTVWLVGVFAVRTRQRQELRREIDQLDAIEKANS
jgi:hypothetical protein